MTAARTATAVEWFLRFQGGPLDKREMEDFERWHSLPANAAAFTRTNQVWHAIGDVVATPEISQLRESILANFRRQ